MLDVEVAGYAMLAVEVLQERDEQLRSLFWAVIWGRLSGAPGR
ncbi:MAG TPA: hypothetical protein VG455_00290 [Acidimicrobiales bacterium]|nr:hypothetical protein [Acidimicrobiales bacterium]